MPKVKCIDCRHCKPWVTDRFKAWCHGTKLGLHRVDNKYSLRWCLLFNPAALQSGGK